MKKFTQKTPLEFVFMGKTHESKRRGKEKSDKLESRGYTLISSKGNRLTYKRK